MQNRKQAGPITSFIMTLIMTIAGFVIAIYFGWPQYQNAKESPNWPQTKGTIIESSVNSEIKRSNKKTKTEYSANIVFQYVVNGKKLIASDTYLGSSNSSSSNRGKAQAIVNKYSKGQEVSVYYSPKDPTTGILEPGVKFEHYMILGIGGIFLLFGGLGLVFSIFKLLAVTTVIAAAAGSALSKSSSKSKRKSHRTNTSKEFKDQQEGGLIDLDDEMDEVNNLSQSSNSPIDDPNMYQWMVVGKKKEYGPFTYEVLMDYLNSGKVKSTHKCYSPSGGGKVQIGKLVDIKKAS